MTPEERASWVRSNFGQRFERLLNEARDLVTCNYPLRKRGRRLGEIAESLGAAVAPVAACRRGCAHCCHQAVAITGYEADRIAEAIGRKRATMRKLAMDDDGAALRARMVRDYSGVACPFLQDGDCSIYAVRPIACSTLFNMSDNPSLCDISRGVQTVPYFNFRDLHMLQAALAFRGNDELADIREFFPVE